ncbi:MAG: primosomal protein N' [Spirochaetales bacterium]|nr:primosomal protein N' [Spirochaetales bacterium]
MYLQIVFNLPLQGPFSYLLPEDMEAHIGFRIEAMFGRRKLTGFVVGTSEERPAGDFQIKPIIRAIDKAPVFTISQVDLSEWMAATYFCTPGEALSAMLPGGRRESLPPVLGTYELPGHRDFKLSEPQNRAVEGILKADEGLFYIHGITGSGKTEVFLTAAEGILAEGKSVIYLVPEIALTRQLIAEVEERFGSGTAILHSRLSPSQRYAQWLRIMSGEARMVIGVRSAIFAPVLNLGLIIVDEEHEGAYKSEATPRYHARQVAMYRGKKEKARVVMGSATPSIEAYHLFHNGGMALYSLTERLAGGGMPEIEVVDMKSRQGGLSNELIHEIRETKARGKQTILFLNRRGFSYFFHCKSCGYEMVCRNCSVNLTYHKGRERMVCHYCGFNQKPVEVCPECGSLDVGYSGFGTELVEEEVSRLFPDLKVARLDTDTAKKKGALETILEEFRAGSTDILLGTQMVAKGLNFPGVRLVGIVMADTGLHMPDFRAAERIFSLLMQVSGRAGRYTDDGKVIIQSYKPDHPAISYAKRGDLEGFYKKELETRKMLGFPPFSRLFRITFRGKDKRKTENAIGDMSQELQASADNIFEIMGPSECPLSIISGNFRFHMLLRTQQPQACRRIIWDVYARMQRPSGMYIEIDSDPISLL